MGKANLREKATIRPIRIDALRVPSPGVAQRKFSQSHGDALAEDFDPAKFGYPVVSRVDSVDWLIDGQHRVYAIQKAGFATAADSVDCEVYEGLSQSQMADLFLGRNRSRLVTAFERFSVAVTAGHPRERAIVAILHGAQLEIGHHQGLRTVHSVGALIRVYERDGPEVLRRVVCILRDAYAGAPAAFGRVLVDGFGLVVAKYAELQDDVLVAAIAKDRGGVHDLLRRAEDYRERLGRLLPQCVAAAVVDVYNRGLKRKDRLTKWWRL